VITSTLPSQTFAQQIEQEFCQGSAISPDLFRSAVELVNDTEVLPGGDVRYPIHEALNWRVTRFGHQAREGQQAAILRNEDDLPWQLKLRKPRIDRKKGKEQKYEYPFDGGVRAFLPAIPLSVWRKICDRNQIQEEEIWGEALIEAAKRNELNTLLQKWSGSGSNAPTKSTGNPAGTGFSSLCLTAFTRSQALTTLQKLLQLNTPALHSLLQGNLTTEVRAALCSFVVNLPSRTRVPSFWKWLERHPEISIIWTEGAKKSLALLSLGHVGIALIGIHGGYRSKDALGNPCTPYLIPDVARFAQPGRRHTLAFDRDEKQKTRYKVERALSRFGGLLESTGGTVEIATWKPEQGKGVDDLIVQGGAAAWESAHSNAMSLLHWQIWQRLENRLTWKPSLKVNTPDLSTLDPNQIPESGIVGVFSAKATGKTKLTARLVHGHDEVLSLTHRIALCRNICERLGLNYRGDLDKTPDGRFITGSAYTLRVGACVDSLLAINPQHFAGCDLVIDEAVQVAGHLLKSSTCAQDGKRPALLARFRELVQVARRVILADADLDNATLHYFKELRGDDAPVFLIRNDYQGQPYPVRLVNSSSFETVVADLLNDLHQLEPGKTLFVATDNKRVTKEIARLVANSFQGKRVLVINAETSGGDAEREFIQTPDKVLQRGDYDLIIASPSLATGVSIESQRIIKRVYGIFTGVSSTDADIAQSLVRVREPVERVVWVANRGRNYSKVGRSTNPLTLKTALMQQTSVTISLVRSSLKADTIASMQGVDWQADPHLNLYCKLAAEQNFSMLHLRDAVMVRLKHEGHQVTIEDRAFDPVARFLYRQAANEQKRLDAEEIAKADILSYIEVEALKQKESRSPEEERAIARFHICEFYAIDPDSLTPEFVLWDTGGRRRGEMLNLESLLYPDTGIEATAKGLEKQATWNQSVCPWDIAGTALRSKLRQFLGLGQFLDPEREWTVDDCASVAEIARQHCRQIQDVLHFTPSEKISDAQIVHQLLSQLGLKVSSRWKGTYGNGKHRVYRLDAQTWQQLTEILKRRQGRRLKFSEQETAKGSPLPLDIHKQTGDPNRISPEGIDKWLSPDSLADIRLMWTQADTPELIEELRRIIPPEVLERAIA
jgi:hypothetical protein